MLPTLYCQVWTQKRSQSPNCSVKRAIQEPHKPLIQTVQSRPADTAPHTNTPTFACLPVALVSSECWTRPWYRAPTYHASIPVHSHAALPSSSLLRSPSLRLNLILAAAKHFHQNLSDWRGAVSWYLLLFHSSVTSGVKDRDGAREEREREGGREGGSRRREKIGSSNLA